MSRIINETLTFDDVQILPEYSSIRTRDSVCLKTRFTKQYQIEIPYVASCMPDVCEVDMACAMWHAGGVGVIHRFMTIDDQSRMVESVWKHIKDELSRWPNRKQDRHFDPISLRKDYPVVAAAIGAVDDYFSRAVSLLMSGANVLMLDVAHGHHENVKVAMGELIKLRNEYSFDIIAGTIATSQAALDLIDWGADALRVGVGGGSACETRIRTGIGVPQLQSVMDVAEAADTYDIPIVSDGGIRYPGDVAKAIVAGAETVMMGNLFAGCDESPGMELVTGKWPDIKKQRIYKGAASASQKLGYNGAVSYVEGATKIIDARGPVSEMIKSLEEGLRSSLSYVGAEDIEQFQSKARFIRITNAGMIEAHPHMLY